MVFSYRLAVIATLGLVPVMLVPTWWMLLAATSVLGLIIVAELLLAGSPRALVITRRGDQQVRLGEELPVELVVTSKQSRRVVGSVRDSWQPSAGDQRPLQNVDLPAGQSRVLSSVLVPRRRGVLGATTVTVRSWGPLRAVARQVTHPVPGSVTVLPPFHARRHLPSRLARLREMDGRSAVQMPGAGHEFDSLRDYVRGDDVRSIDWRATARKQDLVVRTWRPERDRRIVIVLDSSRVSAARVADETRFDSGMEAALLLAALAQAGGDRVEFMVLDHQVRARISSQHQGQMLNQMVSALATVHPRLLAADWSQLPVEVARVAPQRALVVILTSLDSAAVEETLVPVLPLLARKHQILLGSVADPELEDMAEDRSTVEATYRAVAAEKQQNRVAQLTQELQKLNTEVVQATPGEFPPAVADMYLRLKAAGKL